MVIVSPLFLKVNVCVGIINRDILVLNFVQSIKGLEQWRLNFPIPNQNPKTHRSNQVEVDL